MQPFILPKYSKVLYHLQPETKYFIQTGIEAQETPINRLPLELRLAPAKALNVAPNAAQLLLSRECNKGRYKFITGIQETGFDKWYIGNDYEYYRGQKIISLILFHFNCEKTVMELYYFHRFDRLNTYYRLQFASDTIPQLIRQAA